MTEEILTRTMPHPARLSRLEIEARSGEHKVALHDSESAKQFQALVKKPAKAVNGKTEPAPGNISGVPSAVQAEQKAVPASASFPIPQVAPKPTRPGVGQRAPERDPVGTTAPSVRKATGCSFDSSDRGNTLSDEGSRSFMRMTCPACLAVKDIKPKGDRGKFPWHPKRTTTTPNQGVRRVKRESTWKRSNS